MGSEMCIRDRISADMLNFGYDVLVNDDKRALYLLQLQGVDVNLDTTIDDTEFLQQMMTLRMAIEEAKQTQDSVAITDLASEIAQLNAEYAKQFCAAYQQALWQQAVTAALQLRFLARLQAALQELAVTKAFDDDDLYM